MLLSLIIPSFNQAAYLRETLDSILDQGVEAEILVMDGGSSDGTADLLRSYSPRLAHWVSEPDRGQTHAINKGLERMTGDVWAYVNADDPLLPGALATVGKIFADPAVQWVGGLGEIFDASGARGEIRAQPVTKKKDWLAPWNRPHPYVVPFSGCNFMRRKVVERIGFFEESYHYSMDIEFYTRAVFRGGYAPLLVDQSMARWRWHDDTKTMRQGLAFGFREEEIRIAETYLPFLPEEEQALLRRELRREKLLLAPRKICSLLKEQKRAEAWLEVRRSLWQRPDSIFNRAWLGALKRALVN